jgi:hypothetical protein
MSSCYPRALPSATDGIPLIKGAVITESLEVVEFVPNFCQFQLALNASFGAEVSLSLGIVGVSLLVTVNYLVMSGAEAVKVGGNSPVIEISSGFLDKGISGW